MSELLFVHSGTKNEKYEALLRQLPSLMDNQVDAVANMANITAVLSQTFGFFWVGFYRVMDQTLVLGPFQGPLACTRINCGQGVCGAAWEQERTILVKDVHEFPGHIACNEASKSEIVVPVFVESNVVAVLDVDSDKFADFDAVDKEYLEKITACLSAVYH